MSDEVIHIDLDEITKRMDIVISASPNHLTEIKTLLKLKDENIKKLGEGVYSLSIRYKEIKTVGLLNKDLSIEDVARNTEARETIVKDFIGSKEFYSKAKKEKGYKIISDDFSDERSRMLYQGFQSIEARWRRFVLLTSYADRTSKFPKSKNHYKGSPDHPVSMYELSDFLEIFLYQPASDEYLARIWRDSKRSKNDVLRVSKLTKIDELGFSLNKPQLERIRKVRNQCMHFRVLTLDDYEKVVPLINTYLRKEEWERFIKSFRPFVDNITKRLVPDAISIAQAVESMIANQIPSIAETARSISTMAKLYASNNSLKKENESGDQD